MLDKNRCTNYNSFGRLHFPYSLVLVKKYRFLPILIFFDWMHIQNIFFSSNFETFPKKLHPATGSLFRSTTLNIELDDWNEVLIQNGSCEPTVWQIKSINYVLDWVLFIHVYKTDLVIAIDVSKYLSLHQLWGKQWIIPQWYQIGITVGNTQVQGSVLNKWIGTSLIKNRCKPTQNSSKKEKKRKKKSGSIL